MERDLTMAFRLLQATILPQSPKQLNGQPQDQKNKYSTSQSDSTMSEMHVQPLTAPSYMSSSLRRPLCRSQAVYPLPCISNENVEAVDKEQLSSRIGKGEQTAGSLLTRTKSSVTRRTRHTNARFSIGLSYSKFKK